MSTMYPILNMLILLGIIAAWLFGAGWLAYKGHWAWSAGLFGSPIALIVYLFFFIFHPFGPTDRLRVIASATAPDGTLMRLTQSRNADWGEPYSTDLWIKPASRPWGWLYLDHQDIWRRKGQIKIDKKKFTAKVSCDGRTAAEVDLKRLTYKLGRRGDQGEIQWLTDNWEPTDGAARDAAFKPLPASDAKTTAKMTNEK